ncbi:GNAT family N-acetyltransferase [Eubacterium oxidoreducens]|uniref:Ribosomal-protein-alanine N-acetyltransferase n=1 Tax=Eubacterium oxidoreducens TaxID=1732 RepID=A0A1G6CS21_EUBOX|nr:GNAT family protein [Eubacterium oxidoreducens]SDB35555.1 ribosomal-protein-alanine N-acetyltransferase [Eubacterium oxidoreducens]
MNFYYETDRLIIKILDESHATQVLRFLHNNRDIFEPYEPSRPYNFYTINYQKSMLRTEFNLATKLAFVRFWIFPKSNPSKIIGTSSFHNIRKSSFMSLEIGYKFDKYYQKQGYATEAIRFLCDVAFHEMNFHRIEAYVLPDNDNSKRLLDRLGFRNEGLCFSCAKICNEWKDHIRYSLICPSN